MRLVFAGTPELASKVLSSVAKYHEILLAITREDAASGRRGQIEPSPVAREAQRLGIPIHKANRIGPEEIRKLDALPADLGIVVAYGTILPPAALNIFDWWNVHYSLLPAWRGASPAQHAILHGFGGGISLFKIDQGLDSGPILSSFALPSQADETAGEYLDRLTQAAIPILLNALESRPTEVPQTGEVSLAPKISRAAARLDFNFRASDVARKVRAMNPDPVAWCIAHGEPLRVLRAKALGETDWATLGGNSETTGEIVARDKRVLVCCGGGTLLELTEVQPAGRRRMSATDWLRGARNLGRLE